MTKNEIAKLRVKFLKEFDQYVRNCIDDERIIVHWLILGVPDGSTDEELEEIALDDDLWLDCINAFADCCRTAGVI